MTARAGFAYVQARLQACHGARAREADWRAVESSRGAAAYLGLARAGPLARWVQALGESDAPGRLESRLHEQWRARVEEVAGWSPARWRAAVRWFGTLVELPIPAQDDPGASGASHGAASGVGRAGSATSRATRTAAHWIAGWRARMPPGDADAALVEQAAHLLMPRLVDPDGARDARAVAARAQLARLLRWHVGTPAAVFGYLGLEALDLERLRGGLISRHLLAPPARSPLPAETA